MTTHEFDSICNELFGRVLIPLGFTNEYTEKCTFYRKIGDNVYHFIMPDIGSRGAWYDVRVFPHSPAIYPLFEQRFPDNLGIPTDRFSLLSEREVGATQSQFNCKSEDSLRRGFATTVGPLLLKVALPYLDCFQTVADIVPVIRHPSFLGFALHHVGRSDEAVVVLQRERDRLRRLDTTNKDVATVLEHVERLLS
jgi:hypothetical protein